MQALHARAKANVIQQAVHVTAITAGRALHTINLISTAALHALAYVERNH